MCNNHECTDEKAGCNFHIFYHLLNGMDAQQRHSLYIGEKNEHYNYLYNGYKYDGEPSNAGFDLLQDNLKSLGIGRRQQAQLYKLLAAILNLGNITFVDSKTANESCIVKNISQLSLTAELLGVEASALESVLTFKTRLVRRDLISVLLGLFYLYPFIF